MTDLLPCPFCGGPGKIASFRPENLSTYYTAICSECRAEIGSDADTEVEAAAAWNRRATDARIEALEKRVGEQERDVNELDLVVNLLGIEDDHVTPSEAVTHLLDRMAELSASLSAILNTTPEERQKPAIWFKRVDRAKAAMKARESQP